MVRAGAHALSLLSNSLNVNAITALADEPRSLAELRCAIGSPPQTTMRKQLRTLTHLGILEHDRRTRFPGEVDLSLGASGVEILSVLGLVRSWLEQAPGRPIPLDGVGARSALKALVGGWTSTVIRALAAKSLTLTELDQLIGRLNYPSLERRLSAMRSVGLVASRRVERRGSPYVVSDWLREAVAPLLAAAHWERRHLDPTLIAPITGMDVEAALLLLAPLLRLPRDLNGTCRVAFELSGGNDPEIAGVVVGIRKGTVASCVSRLGADASAWASGTTSRWLATLFDDYRAEDLELGGDTALASAIRDGLRCSLRSHGETRALAHV